MIASSIRFARSRGRGIVQLTMGHTHGPITRLMSPGDLGELVKPFAHERARARARGGRNPEGRVCPASQGTCGCVPGRNDMIVISVIVG